LISESSEPKALAVVRVYVVVSLGESITDPLPPLVRAVTSPGAGVIDHVLANLVDHFRVTLSPALIVLRSDMKEVICGTGFTVIAISWVDAPSSLMALRV
jgi:hypothetical protein